LIKFSLPPSPYFKINSSTANLAASAKKVSVPAAGSKTVTVSFAKPSVLLKGLFKILCKENQIEVMVNKIMDFVDKYTKKTK